MNCALLDGAIKYKGDKYKEPTTHEKWSFLLRISIVNLTKSTGEYRFCHIY